MLVLHDSNSPHIQGKRQNSEPQNFEQLKAKLAGRHVEKLAIEKDILYTGLINKQGEATDDIGIIEYVAKGTIFTGKVVNGKPAGQGRLAKGHVTIADGFLFWNPKTNTIEKAKDTIETKSEDKENRFPITMASGFLNASQRKTEMRAHQNEDEYYIGERNADGKKHGRGMLRFSDNVYTGEFKNDLFDGNGEITYANGDKYAGEFQRGKKGKGVYQHYDKQTGKFNEFHGTFDGDRFEGEIRYPDGAKYVGQVLNLLRDGNGKFDGSKGYMYEGEWQKDLRHGKGQDGDNKVQREGIFNCDKFKSGKVKYAHGDFYEGEFGINHPHGKGKTIYVNKDVYEGEYKDGLFHGRGILTSYAGGSYNGEWRNNKPDGQGTFTFRNGDVYEGDFHEGLRTGQGTFTYSNGDSYTGGFLNDEYHGEGVLLQPAEDFTYKGNFFNGFRHGKGKCTKSGDVYDGDWVNGTPTGQGTFKTKNFISKGSFLNGLKHGKNTLRNLQKGEVYDGEWFEDVPAGKFIVITKKYSYEGDFFDFKRHGQGCCVYTSGKIQDGHWIDDKFVGSQTTDELEQDS